MTSRHRVLLAVNPSRTQITRHVCEEGWSAIAQSTGVPLHTVLETAGILPTARSVVLYLLDDWVTSIDLSDALHRQTILAYGMNGRDLPMPTARPWLRLETQLGQKPEIPASHRTATPCRPS